MNTTQTIHQYALHLPNGKPFTTRTLLGVEKRSAIDQAISRLIKTTGKITRIARGILCLCALRKLSIYYERDNAKPYKNRRTD